MNSKRRFSALETMCRERAQRAKKDMEYWLAEAEEWKWYKESSDPFIEGIPVQLDWCADFSDISVRPEVPPENRTIE